MQNKGTPKAENAASADDEVRGLGPGSAAALGSPLCGGVPCGDTSQQGRDRDGGRKIGSFRPAGRRTLPGPNRARRFEDLLGPSSNMHLFGLGMGLSVPVALTPRRPEDVSGLTLGGMRTERLAVKPPARKS